MKLKTANKFSDLYSLIEEEDREKTIGVFPGAFKPPHKGHYETARAACGECDTVYIFMSNKARELGVPSVDRGGCDADRYGALLHPEKSSKYTTNLNVKLAEVSRLTSASEMRAKIASFSLDKLDIETFKENLDQFLPPVSDQDKRKVSELLMNSVRDQIISANEADRIWEIYIEDLRRQFPDTQLIYRLIEGSPVKATYDTADELNTDANMANTTYNLRLYVGC